MTHDEKIDKLVEEIKAKQNLPNLARLRMNRKGKKPKTK